MTIPVAEKNKIIKKFLESYLLNGYEINENDVPNINKYQEVCNSLDELERFLKSHGGILQFENMKKSDFEMLDKIMTKYLSLDYENNGFNRVDLEMMKSVGLKYGLPQPDYFNRKISFPQMTAETDNLITAAKAKLETLVDTIVRNENDFENFDLANNDHLKQLINHFKSKMEIPNENPITLENNIKVIEDLLKVKNLTQITIPDEKKSRDFFTLVEAVGGVTQKISLISQASVHEKLTNITNNDLNDIDGYMAGRNNYKLSTEAILKFPKNQRITNVPKQTEVQRESIALNISRILGLSTTHSSMMLYENTPVLFVPYDNIKLLQDFAKGNDGHYATINPIGEGLQDNRFVEDFGNVLPLLYLCADPDAIGKNCQNKALSNDKSFYVFDQVVMDSSYITVDSRLSQVPNHALLKHIKDFRGRNRTVIDDSSIKTKFDGLQNLINNKDSINDYMDNIINTHKEKIETINSELNKTNNQNNPTLIQQRNEIENLKIDAEKIKTVINARIDAINEILPTKSAGLTEKDQLQALILEKLVNGPRLFNEWGRPYRNPWTHRNNNVVQSIETDSNANIVINFSKSIPIETVNYLKNAGELTTLTPTTSFFKGSKLTMSKADFDKLDEKMLFPETNTTLDLHRDYLDNLDQIANAYAMGHRNKIEELITKYRSEIGSKNDDSAKLELIKDTLSSLKDYITDLEKRSKNTGIKAEDFKDNFKKSDQGFGMHVLKKLHFDIQQHLQSMIPNKNMNNAFAAALELDRVADFQKGVMDAIQNKKTNTTNFDDFLKLFIDQRVLATDNKKAISASNETHRGANDYISDNLELIIPDILENVNEKTEEDKKLDNKDNKWFNMDHSL